MLPTATALRARIYLLFALILTLAGLIITLQRSPTSWPDSQLYASIAKSRAAYGDGVPSMLRRSPEATDHIRFYGPVFFDLAAASFKMLGVSKWSFRLVSLAGALLFALSGALLAQVLTGSRDRALVAMLMILLTPEITLHARTGSMDTVAIGLEFAALAIFARGVVTGTRPRRHGVASGICLALAALTTPRTYPFVAAFAGTGVVLAWRHSGRRLVLESFMTAAVVMGAIVSAWVTFAHGDLMRWLYFVSYIGSHEDTDVAILPTATRTWEFVWAAFLSPAVAAIGVLWAARARVGSNPERPRESAALAFVLMTGSGTFIMTAWSMTMPLTVGTYVALPLFAIVVALPPHCYRVRGSARGHRLIVWAVGAVLCAEAAVAAVRYLRVAATWQARNPAPLIAFLRERVPAGAEVVGSGRRFFFAVEEIGAHYSSESPASPADWSRWVPGVDPQSVGPVPRRRVSSERFLLWRADDTLPHAYGCAIAHALGTYEPPLANALSRMGTITQGSDVGYPRATLYRLLPNCPSAGYDPTGGARSRPAPQRSTPPSRPLARP